MLSLAVAVKRAIASIGFKRAVASVISKIAVAKIAFGKASAVVINKRAIAAISLGDFVKSLILGDAATSTDDQVLSFAKSLTDQGLTNEEIIIFCGRRIFSQRNGC